MSILATTQHITRISGQLGRLEESNLIRLAAVQPELEYVFRHALIQESAYLSLVRADRRRVHRAAGQALEAEFADNSQSLELALQLARHFEEAGEDERAIRYYALAGDAALGVYANAEAVAAYSHALAAAGRSPAGAEQSSTDVETWQHLFANRGRALELNSQFDAALANYQAMAQCAETLGSRRLALTAAVASEQLYATATPLFDPPLAERMAATALAEARALADEATEAKILWSQLNVYRFTQRNAQARVSGERSLEIANRLGLKEQAALNLNDLIHVYADLGLWALARQAGNGAGRLWRELGNTAMLADSLSTTSLYTSLLGDFSTALSQAQEAQRLSLSIGNLWGQSYSFSGMIWPYWYSGQPDRAIEVSEACIRVGRLAGYLVAEVFDQARLGYMLGELGNVEGGLALLAQAEASTKHVGGVGQGTILAARIHLELQARGVETAAATLERMETTFQSPPIWEVDAILRSRCEVALAQGDNTKALAVTQAHITQLHELGLEVYLPEALLNRARALERAGRSLEARECLLEACERAARMQARMLEWTMLYALGEFEAQHGRPAEAGEAWGRARDIVSAIASNVPTPELRASFRARRDVRALLGEAAPAAFENHPAAPNPPAL